MSTGEFGINDTFRNQQVNLTTVGSEMGTATASSGAATLNAYIGKITTEALSTAAAAEYTLTLTNNKIGANDFVLVSVDKKSSAGSPALGECTVTAGQVIITISNVHASAAFNAAIQINFMVIKALTAGQPGG